MRDPSLRRALPFILAATLIACLSACRSPAPASPPPPPPITEGPGTFKAILINGGGKKQSNFHSHLTHVRTLVEFLQANGADADDLTIFSSDGPDPAADLATRARPDDSGDAWLLPPRAAQLLRPVQFIDSTVDGYTLRPATFEALHTWFTTEGKQLHRGDTLLLYVTDHGEQNKTDLTNNNIMLWNEKLSVEQLRQLLAELDPERPRRHADVAVLRGLVRQRHLPRRRRAHHQRPASAATSPRPPTARPTAAIPRTSAATASATRIASSRR